MISYMFDFTMTYINLPLLFWVFVQNRNIKQNSKIWAVSSNYIVPQQLLLSYLTESWTDILSLYVENFPGNHASDFF